MQPYEVKTMHEFWYPLPRDRRRQERELEAAVRLEVQQSSARIGAVTTADRPDARVVVEVAGKQVFERAVAITPAKPFMATVDLPAGTREQDVKLAVLSDSAN